jgi:hypothetical protein
MTEPSRSWHPNDHDNHHGFPIQKIAAYTEEDRKCIFDRCRYGMTHMSQQQRRPKTNTETELDKVSGGLSYWPTEWILMPQKQWNLF